MGRQDEVRVRFTAEISDLRKKLAEASDVTGAEARKMVSNLNKSIRAVEREQARANKAAGGFVKAQQSVATATNKTANVTRSLAIQLPDVASQLAAGAPPAQVFAQQGLQVVQVHADDLMNALKGLGLGLRSLVTVMGPVAVVAAAAGAAYLYFADELRDAEAAQKAASEEAERAESVFGLLGDTMRALQDDIRLVTGEVSALDLALEKQQAQIDRQFTRATRTVERQIAALKERRAALREDGQITVEVVQEIEALTGSIEHQERALAALNARQSRAKDEAELVAFGADAEAVARDNATAAADAEREALRALAEQQRADREGRDAIVRAMREQATAQQQLADIRGQLGMDGQSDEERAINAEYNKRVALLDEIARATGYNDELNAAFLENERQRFADLAELEDERTERYVDAARRRGEAEQRAAEELVRAQRQAASAARSALLELSGATSDAIGAMVEANAKPTAAGMRAAFAAQKALSLGMVPVRVAEGLSTAATLPPPADAIKRAAVIATGIASTAAIAAAKPPKFNDTPGVVQIQGGGTVGAAPGDYVAMSKDLRDLARQVNSAAGSTAAPELRVVAIPSYEGRVYRRARRDSYRQPGPDFDAVNTGRKIGLGSW